MGQESPLVMFLARIVLGTEPGDCGAAWAELPKVHLALGKNSVCILSAAW
jgi:hypothetical protein